MTEKFTPRDSRSLASNREFACVTRTQTEGYASASPGIGFRHGRCLREWPMITVQWSVVCGQWSPVGHWWVVECCFAD